MENIRQAVERAKTSRPSGIQPQEQMASALQQPQMLPYVNAPGAPQLRGKEVALNRAQLESSRIIAHDIADPRSKSFDMLRTQVLQSMEMKSWQILGVTSPTAGCGKTVVSINLALSIARQQDRSVLLLDLDLQKPQLANYLGLSCDQGVLSVLEGRTDLPSSVIQARIGKQLISVLPCEAATLYSSEWMASRPMNALLQDIKRDFRNWTVIIDLPPVLVGDDVISILPQIDCMLFVAAVGTSTVSEIKESNKHLESAAIVRVVLNKSSEMPATYYSRYAERK
jgi:Mrp family chromosome partitioning ATPase